MKFEHFMAERGKFIQSRERAPDHCRINPADAKELLQTAPNVRVAEMYAVIGGIPVLQDERVPAGEARFEIRERMPYEAAPAFQKRRRPR